MKKILVIALSFLSIGVAFAESDYLSSQSYASNKVFVEEIVAMEGAVAFVGRSSAKPYPHASYAVLIKDENAKYTQLCFGSKELDDDKNFINFTLHKNRMPKEGENPNYEYPVDEANANIYLKALAEQIALAAKKGDNDGDNEASLYVNKIGVIAWIALGIGFVYITGNDKLKASFSATYDNRENSIINIADKCKVAKELAVNRIESLAQETY